MASADDLRGKIAANREALRTAIQAVGGKWTDSPGGDEWTPKQVAEHVIGGEVYFANMVSKAMLGKPGEWERKEIASAAEALERHDAAVAMADRAYKYVEDRDLVKPAENVPGTEKQTVEGAMERAAAHLEEHATQLQALA